MRNENVNKPQNQQSCQNAVMPSLLSLDFKVMRQTKGLTLINVEEMTGISNAYLSQLENGEIKQPSYNTVITLIMLYSDILGLDNSWSLKDVLKKLIEASEILLHQKNYDGHGWEEINHCVERGKSIVSTLSCNEA